MRNRLIYICSPLRGDIEKNIQKAQGYCREAVELWLDVIPIAPHVYCTQFLDDTIPQEREAGMELGIALLDMCDELWVYGINNPSEGMKKGNRLRQRTRDPGKRRRRSLSPPGAGGKPAGGQRAGRRPSRPSYPHRSNKWSRRL